MLSSGPSRHTGLGRARGSVIYSLSLSLFPLQGVAKAAQAKIVLSTDWRRHPQLKTQLIHALRSLDMDVIGATPCRPNWQALPYPTGLIFTTTTSPAITTVSTLPPYAHPHLVPPHLLHRHHPTGRRCGHRRSRRGCKRITRRRGRPSGRTSSRTWRSTTDRCSPSRGASSCAATSCTRVSRSALPIGRRNARRRVGKSPSHTLPPPRPPPTPPPGAATSGVRGGPRRSRALPWVRGAAHVRPSRCPGGGKGATRAPPPCQMAQWVQWPNGPIGPLAQGGPYVVAKPCALAGHVRVRFRVTPPGGMHDGPSCYQPEGCSS